MSLDVVYCDSGEQTCVAVAVPIKFPYHCDNGERPLLLYMIRRNVVVHTFCFNEESDPSVLFMFVAIQSSRTNVDGLCV